MDTDNLWKTALGELEVTVSPANFGTWFGLSFVFQVKDETLIIGFPSNFHTDKFNHQFKTPMLEIIKRLSNNTYTNLKGETHISPSGPTNYGGLFAEKPNSPEVSAVPVYKTRTPTTNPTLNKKYIFETFVVGSHNQLAHAAAGAAAEKPGEIYNPLFIYGGPGLGKTHLMQAVGNLIWSKNQNSNVIYASSERFTNEFVGAISTGKTKDFKSHYRGADVLLVDDIQFISHKEQTLEEFFHTFNALHQNNKQIILTSDRPPKAIRGLPDRLVSRFVGGLVVDIQPPDLETRMAILIRKANEKNQEVQIEVIQFLATVFKENVRELEGALNKVLSASTSKNSVLTLDFAKSVLKEANPLFKREAPDINKVFSTVASYYHISIDELLGARRQKELVRPRQVVMYLLKNETNLSFPIIGREMRGKDHTTIMHGVKKIEAGITTDPTLSGELSELKEKLYS